MRCSITSPPSARLNLAFPLVHVDANYGPYLAGLLPFCGIARGVLLWGSLCHHVQREAGPASSHRATFAGCGHN